MSTQEDQARELAERIARRVSLENPQKDPRSRQTSEVGAELAAVRAGLGELQRRIAQLEAKIGSEPKELDGGMFDSSFDTHTRPRPVPVTHSPWLAGVNATFSHPSQEKFGVEEATVSELVDFFEKEKTCGVEPGGKPCDHCAMCSSRGF
jgi:hypothetical protein